MSRERPRPQIRAPSQSESIVDDDDYYDDDESDSQSGSYLEGDEVDPRESASATDEYRDPRRREHSRGATRTHSRHHSNPRQRLSRHQGAPPPAASVPGSEHIQTMGSESSDFYGYGPLGAPYYERPGVYPQNNLGGFAPPPHAPPFSSQVVPWGANPFTPQHGQGGAYGYGHEVMPYGQHGYYGAAGPVAPSNYVMPSHITQMIYPRPPAPPATEVAAPASAPPAAAPPPEKKPDPELERVKAQLEVMQLERKKADEAQERAEAERKIRQDAEREFQNRMEQMKLAQVEAQKEIEMARQAAEHAARQRIEEERKAEEERKRMEADMRAQAAREERERIQQEKIAEDARAKAHAEALEKAERVAREKYEQARQAEEDRKVQMEKERAALEAETRNKIAAERKAAEEAAAAAAAKAAEEVARKELLEKEAKIRAIQEYEEKLAKDKKEAEDKVKAEAAAKLAYENEFRLKQEEEKKKAEDAAAAAEAKKKEDEETAKKLLAKAKADLEKAGDDGKEPVKFKDAVGRKFTFPFRLAANWETMRELINQAFSHIPEVGPHVQKGRYDLEGPEGELILREIWSTTIQPGWQITMKMWPNLDRFPLHSGVPGRPGLHMPANFPGMRPGFRPQPQPMGGQMPMPPPGAGFPMFGRGGPPPRPTVVEVVEERRPHKKSSSKTKKAALGWLSGASGGVHRKRPSRHT